MLRINSLHTQLWLAFLGFALINVVLVIGYSIFDRSKEYRQQVLAKLHLVNLDNQTTRRLERDFALDETINPQFYRLRQSEYLTLRTNYLERLYRNLRSLRRESTLQSANTLVRIDSLLSLKSRYEQVFAQYVDLTLERGFKDYGLEGQLRRYIHEIENLTKARQLNQTNLLTIRRHEKDFMLRKEYGYVKSVQKAIALFQQVVSLAPEVADVRPQLLELLDNYKKTFLKIVQTEERIGLSDNAGVRQNLALIARSIDNQINALNHEVDTQMGALSVQSRIFGWVLAGACLLISLGLAMFVTRVFARPVKQLSSTIHEVIAARFEQVYDFSPLIGKNELGQLASDFSQMVASIRVSLQEINHQKQRVERRNQLLQDSINYAQKIQQAILPTELEFRRYFADFFVLYRPLHTVSGDFYWLSEVNNQVFLAVVDCTGHGVPGAFMSMIGHTILNEIVNEKRINDPAFILEVLDLEIRKALRQEQSGNNDGMELSLCKIEGVLEKNFHLRVTFAGAKGKTFYSLNGEIHRLKGTKRAIGGDISAKTQSFENYTFELPAGSCLYLCTDGIIDQPDIRRKRYGAKQLVRALSHCSSLPLSSQHTHIQNELDEYAFSKGVEARDDITLLGVML